MITYTHVNPVVDFGEARSAFFIKNIAKIHYPGQVIP